jgi:ubiquinone/menaquinone biosynthesis C-methylase UbiE
MRKDHNMVKRKMIQKFVQRGQTVLDCGCGRGGDLLKWQSVGAVVTGVDPDAESLTEAKRRAHDMNFQAKFYQGDILSVTSGPFDVVCYNFSLHYIAKNFEKSLKTIVEKIKPGGILMGVVPDVDRLGCEWFKDRLGNTCVVNDDGTLEVCLTDGPFYKGEPKVEPILDLKVLKQLLKNSFETIVWEPMVHEPTGLISDMYTKFVFKKNLS